MTKAKAPEEIHPMIPVPDAIRIVLKETAKHLLLVASVNQNKKKNPNRNDPNPNNDNNTDLLMRTERVSVLEQSTHLLDSVLVEDVIMAAPGYPPYNASVMDGYAIHIDADTDDWNTRSGSKNRNNHASNNDADSWTHRVVDKIYAGDDPSATAASSSSSLELQSQSQRHLPPLLPPAYYVTTGAVLPASCNCVVPIEEWDVQEEVPPDEDEQSSTPSTQMIRIKATAVLQPQHWIRARGCDIAAGAIVLPHGHVLDPVAIGLLRQCRVAHITIKKRIRVGVFSTGNELINADDAAEQYNTTTTTTNIGKIPDTNRPVLLSMLATWNTVCTAPMDLGIVRDDSKAKLREAFRDAFRTCDIVLTSGGVSMGERDILEQTLVEGFPGAKVHFGRVHMKPGKPTTFLTIPFDDTNANGSTTTTTTKFVFAMPGNPCSAIVCTHLFVKPCVELYFHGIPTTRTTLATSPNSVAAAAAAEEEKEKEEEEPSPCLLESIVNESFVHPEIQAELLHDIKLDPIRPEYHRVILSKKFQNNSNSNNNNQNIRYTYEATSTGVQRSSRLMSLRDAHGLMVLPHSNGSSTTSIARKGDTYPVLLLENNRLLVGPTAAIQPVRIRDSLHFNTTASAATSAACDSSNTNPDNETKCKGDNRRSINVGVVEVVRTTQFDSTVADSSAVSITLEETCRKISNTLNGSTCSGNSTTTRADTFVIAAKQTFVVDDDNNSLEELYPFVVNKIVSSADDNDDIIDLVVVVLKIVVDSTSRNDTTGACTSSSNSSWFLYHLDVTKIIKDHLIKEAKTLALQARAGAATESPSAAVFETVVGTIPTTPKKATTHSTNPNNTALLVCVPDIGLVGALTSIRGAIKHAIQNIIISTTTTTTKQQK